MSSEGDASGLTMPVTEDRNQKTEDSMDLVSFTIGLIAGIAIGALLMIERFFVRDERKYVHLSAESNAVYILQLQATEKEDAR